MVVFLHMEATHYLITFTDSEIKTTIQKLKPNLSAGPDRLPPLLFKKLKHILARQSCSTFTQLLSVGCVPDDWTKGIITPVHKKGIAQVLLTIIDPYH